MSKLEELEERVQELEEAVFSENSSESYTSKQESVAEFLKRHDISTHNDRALAIGYYLEKIEEKDNFTSADIEEKYREAKIKPPQTVAVTLSKNAKKGFVMEDGEGENHKQWVLTRSGEEKVENELGGEADE